MNKLWHTTQRFVRWLFGAPFQELPPEFGDTVPPELREFGAELEGSQHRIQSYNLLAAGSVKNPGPAKTGKADH